MKLRSLSDLHTLLPDQPKKDHDSAESHNGKGRKIHVSLDSKGRKGKIVTVISGLQHNPATMEDIARILKQHCAAGGSVKMGSIEIQGDQQVRVTQKLSSMNYVVK